MEKSGQLLLKYEKIKGFSSDLFDNEDWANFDAFCFGYDLAMNELETKENKVSCDCGSTNSCTKEENGNGEIENYCWVCKCFVN